MKYVRCGFLLAALSVFCGCSADVETTGDSTRVEVEGPELEVGDKPADLDPSSDEDIDVDTPAPGDR